MKVFKYKQFEPKAIEDAFKRRSKKEGILRRREVETTKVSAFLMRPFRQVNWELREISETVSSFVDEGIANVISDPDESLLLWRPNYANLPFEDLSDSNVRRSPSISQTDLGEKVSSLIERRRSAQEKLAELEPEMRQLQIDRRQAVQLILPRTTLAGFKEARVVKERLTPHSVLLATSMVSNCSNESIIEGVTLEKTVYVPTSFAKYTQIDVERSRLDFIEMAGVSSIGEALRNGRALTRLCTINKEAMRLLETHFE